MAIFLQDDESKQQFMVDTGPVCSVLPHRSKMSPTGPQLSGTNGKAIPCWVSVRRRLTFGLRTFFVTFLLAAVYRPIIGLDFLSAHGLLVNPVSRQVLDSKSLKPLSKLTTATRTLHSKFATALWFIALMVRPLPPTQHPRPLQQAARLQVLLLHRPGEGLPSDTDGCPRRR